VAGAQDAKRNLSAIGNQYFTEAHSSEDSMAFALQ
jgi:hypothetical protein